MSRFAGWVQYRRGIIEHVLDGRLTGHEHYALSQLILLADAATGGDRINAPLLCYYTGHVFNQDSAQRILNSLHDKGYIWYRAKPFSTKSQPYWINHYTLTKGPMKARMTRIEKLLEKSMISQEDVWKAADETTDEIADGTTDNYKTREKKQETGDYPSTVSRERTSLSGSMMRSETASTHSTQGEACAPQSASLCASLKPSPTSRMPYCATDMPLVTNSLQNTLSPKLTTTLPVSFTWGDEIAGYQFATGESPAYRCLNTGRRIVAFDEARRTAMSQRSQA